MPTLSALRTDISGGRQNLGTSTMHLSQLSHPLCPQATLGQRLRSWLPMIPAALTCERGETLQTFRNINFGTPEENVVACVPAKARLCGYVLGNQETFIFNEHDEAEYARNYRASYYAYTWKKAG